MFRSFLYSQDEKKLDSIRVGMSAREVEAILGPATLVETDRSSLASPVHRCRSPDYETAHVYYRKSRASLFVYFDSQSHVDCVERIGYLVIYEY